MAANKSFQDKKTTLETKRQQLAAKLAKLEAEEKERQRKKEQEQRTIVGAAVLAHAKIDPAFAAMLHSVLEGVTKPADRKALADLLTPPAATPAPERDTTANDKTETT